MTDFIIYNNQKLTDRIQQVIRKQTDWPLNNVISFEEFLKKFRGYIAGGAISRASRGIDGGDIDVYFHTKEDLEQAKSFVYSEFKKKGLNIYCETENSITLTNSLDVAKSLPSTKSIPIQLVKVLIGKPTEVLEQFDFVHVMAVYEPLSELIIAHKYFATTNTFKEIRINRNAKTPIKLLPRVVKYVQDQNFKISHKEIANLIAITISKLSEIKTVGDAVKEFTEFSTENISLTILRENLDTSKDLSVQFDPQKLVDNLYKFEH